MYDGGKDTFIEGDCDAAGLELVRLAGWEADFAALEGDSGAGRTQNSLRTAVQYPLIILPTCELVYDVA